MQHNCCKKNKKNCCSQKWGTSALHWNHYGARSFNNYTFALVSLLDAYNIPLYLYLDFTLHTVQTLTRPSKQIYLKKENNNFKSKCKAKGGLKELDIIQVTMEPKIISLKKYSFYY